MAVFRVGRGRGFFEDNAELFFYAGVFQEAFHSRAALLADLVALDGAVATALLGVNPNHHASLAFHFRCPRLFQRARRRVSCAMMDAATRTMSRQMMASRIFGQLTGVALVGARLGFRKGRSRLLAR